MAKRKRNDETTVVFTRMTLEDAWERCNSVAAALGLVPDRNTPKQELHFDLSRERPDLFWLGVVVGFLLYILPGLYLLWRYRTIELAVRFSATSAGTLVAGRATASSREAWLVFDQFRHCLADNPMTVEMAAPQPVRAG